MVYQGNKKEKITLFTSLPARRKKTDKLDYSGVYRIKCGNCEKYIGQTGRKIALQLKDHQRLCKNLDTERSEIAEHIARTRQEIYWKSTEKLAANGENTRKRKIREAIDILTERNLMKKAESEKTLYIA
ncbi:unnamed protein product [Protopolystoma xenopodis]|uniref:GIY-YIG domain-containing protein n=1 Tax=Protopolystoma xenopodis TaxID=117903 RepID=A0A448XC46_9PLAT|nr:unnamed protein product [Protopolystoma xenopodis]